MTKKYSLDANVFIDPWNTYYPMNRAPGYWNGLDELGQDGYVFCTDEVRLEIVRQKDGLADWLKQHLHIVRFPPKEVQENLRRILSRFPRLVDTVRNRSMADPWVIAHAMHENAVVVTNEELTNSATRIKIPNVCRDLNIECINVYQFVQEAGIQLYTPPIAEG